MNEFIVAEVSKNWTGNPLQELVPSGCISGLFEHVILTNRNRGYVLHSWQLHRLMTGPDSMNETIIAVFREERS